MDTETKPVIFIDDSLMLPDNSQWEKRFEVKSETSDRVYIVAQNKQKRHWACSCPGWKRYRKCKHLQEIGLPINEQPHEIEIKSAY